MCEDIFLKSEFKSNLEIMEERRFKDFFEAVRLEDVDQVKKFLNEGIDVNSINRCEYFTVTLSYNV